MADKLPPFEDTLPVDDIPPFDASLPADEPPPFEQTDPAPIKIADFINNGHPLPPPPIEKYTPEQLAKIPHTVTSPADAVMSAVEAQIQAVNPIKNEADLAAAKKIIYDPANPPFKNMADLGAVARAKTDAESLKAQGVDVPQFPPEYDKALHDWTMSNFEGLVMFPAAMGAALQGLRWYAANYTLPGAARAAVRAISDNLKTKGISPENADAMAKAGLKKAIQDGIVNSEGTPGDPTIKPSDLVNVRKAAEKGYLPVTSDPVQTIPSQIEGPIAPTGGPIPSQVPISEGPSPITTPEVAPGAFPAGPVPVEPPTFDGMALAMRIKQAIGLNPLDALTPEKLQYAYDEGTLPQDLAEKIGLPAAVQQGELSRAKEAAAQRADIEKAAQADLEQQAVTAHADAVLRQVSADGEHAIAQATRAQELLVPEEITGKPIADMSEEEFAALARQAMPEAGGEVIQDAYDTAIADAQDMNLSDGRPVVGTPAELPVDHEFDHLGDEGLDPVVKMDYEAAQSEAPGLTEAQHRSMVKDAIDAYAIQPEDVQIKDLKDYALKKESDESNAAFAHAQTADQLSTKGHATPILNMLWRRKFNKGNALKGGDLDASALRGYFTDKGGMTVQQATENAYEMGWIPENDEGLFREALDSEIMKRDGLGVREKGAEYRPEVKPTFYSKLAQVIEAKMGGSAPADQIRGLVASAGVKQDELDWYNLDGFLKDNPKPTKAQVLDYLAANSLEIKEVVKGGPSGTGGWVVQNPNGVAMERTAYASKEDAEEAARNYQEGWNRTRGADSGSFKVVETDLKTEITPTKFEKYVLPGGENYREVLFTLPGKDKPLQTTPSYEEWKSLQEMPDPMADPLEMMGDAPAVDVSRERYEREKRPMETVERKAWEENQYKSLHWSEPNVISHLRLNDRTIDGKRTLFIEEVQSDIHQKGREVGYAVKDLPEGWSYKESPSAGGFYVHDTKGEVQAFGNTKKEALEDYLRTTNATGAVPNFPLKKTWPEFVMKRAIRMAAEQGYDAVAWTNGAQQAERYDLSKQVDSIAYNESTGLLTAWKNGARIMDENAKPEDLPGIIGKDAAKKLTESTVNKKGVKEISGTDLKVGGEGMKTFYDQMLPSFVNKFTKKWGGKVEDVSMAIKPVLKDARFNLPREVSDRIDRDIELEALQKGFTEEKNLDDYMEFVEGERQDRYRAWGEAHLADSVTETVHSLTITPELRRAAMTEGFSLFSPGHVYQPGEMLATEGDSIPGGIEVAGHQAVADVKKVRSIGQAHDLRLDPAVRQINKRLMEKQFASVVGLKIETIQDSAEITAFTRHPFIEHFSLVKLKDGEIKGSLVLTSGKVGYVDLNEPKIQAFLATDCDAFYAAHGHPSGNSTPSAEDIASTKAMAADSRFKGHVVHNHKTYTAIMPDGTAIAQDYRGEKQSFRTDMTKMTTSPAVVGWVQSVALGDSLGIMFTDSQLQVMSFDQVDPRSDYNAYIKRHAKGYGSTGVFLVAGDAAHARMAPRRFAGNYHDYLVLSDDGTYRSAALGYLDGFKVSPYTSMGFRAPEGHFEALKVSETAADYNPDDYNKVTGRWKPGMALTLKSRLVSAVFRDGLPRGSAGTLVSVNPATGVMRVDFGGHIVRATPNMFKETWREPGAPQPGQKPLSLPTTLKGFDSILPEVKKALGGNYDVNTHESSLAEARVIIAKDPIKALGLVYAAGDSVVATSVTQAVTSLMIIKLQNEGNIPEVIKICDHLAKVAKGSGQVVEFVKAIRQLGPDGIISYAKQKIGLALAAGKWGKLIEKLNALTLDQDRVDFCKKHGMPYLSVEKCTELRNTAIEIAKMPEGYDKNLSTAENLRKITEAIPKTLGDKIASIQRLSQLLAAKTLDRNIIGNMMFTGLDNFNQVIFAVPIDKAMHIVFGTPRTQALPDWAAWKMGAKEGAVQGWKESMAGVDLSSMHNKYDLPDGFTFQNPFLRFCEKALNVGLRASDKINYTAQRYNVLSQLMKLEKLNGRVTKFPTPEMLQRANDESLWITFNDPNTLRCVTTKLKKVLNLGRKWGLGNQVINYPGTPSSLIMRSIEYSPFNLVTTVKIFIDAGRGKGWDQERFSKNLSRMLTGGIFLIGSSFVLASVGLMTGRKKNKKAVAATLRVEGLKDYQINITGMMRFLSSGFRPEAAIWQKGDTLYTYDWAQPIAPLIAMGANIAESTKSREGFVETGVNALVSGVDTLMQQPLLQGIEQLFSNSKLIIAGQEVEGNAFLIGVLKTLKDVPASFMPQALNEVRQLVDNVSRNTNDPDLVVEFVYSVKNKVPWMSKSLVKNVDVLGQVRKVYQDEGNSVFNVIFNPGFVSKYHPTPTTKMVLDIWARSGYTIQIPRVAPLSITVKGMKRPLSNIEQREFQHTIGYLTARKFDQLASDPDFNAKSDKEKADYLERYLKYVYDFAKYSDLGVRE